MLLSYTKRYNIHTSIKHIPYDVVVHVKNDAPPMWPNGRPSKHCLLNIIYWAFRAQIEVHKLSKSFLEAKCRTIVYYPRAAPPVTLHQTYLVALRVCLLSSIFWFIFIFLLWFFIRTEESAVRDLLELKRVLVHTSLQERCPVLLLVFWKGKSANGKY